MAAYKSVAVPLDSKPRSTMTRVAKVPMAARSVNTLTKSVGRKKMDDGARMGSWERQPQEVDEELRVEDLRF